MCHPMTQLILKRYKLFETNINKYTPLSKSFGIFEDKQLSKVFWKKMF